MAEIAQIRQEIERDLFDYQQLTAFLSHLSKPRDKINKLLGRGEIIRIRKGLYAFAPPYRRGAISRELLANLVYGPSYVSLEYTLSYHGLIPERVSTITSVALGRSRTFDTPLGTFTYRSLSLRRYAVGATLVPSAAGSFLMAWPEKALADKVWADKRLSNIGASDFKPYLEDDLRIDPVELAQLDPTRFQTIDEAYASPKIRSLFRFLRAFQEAHRA